jgi:hypothetical protein
VKGKLLDFGNIFVISILILIGGSADANDDLNIPQQDAVIQSHPISAARTLPLSSAVAYAFEGIRQAEAAGADVSNIIDRFNSALDLERQAGTLEYESCASNNSDCVHVAKGIFQSIIEESQLLKQNAEQMSTLSALMIFIVYVPVGAFAVSLAVFYSYKALNSRKLRKLQDTTARGDRQLRSKFSLDNNNVIGVIRSRAFGILFLSSFAIIVSIAFISSQAWPEERFASISTLGSNMTADNYYHNDNNNDSSTQDSTIKSGEEIKWYLYAYNHLGNPELFSIRAKIFNSTQSLPSEPNSTDKGYQIFKVDHLLEHGSSWLTPLTWSVTDVIQEDNQVVLRGLKVNGIELDNLNIRTEIDGGFRITIELWRYDIKEGEYVFFGDMNDKGKSGGWNQIWFRIIE